MKMLLRAFVIEKIYVCIMCVLSLRGKDECMDLIVK